MSRYTITATRTASRHSDPDAIIGYDRPLQTFFLQAFPDADGEDLELWLVRSFGSSKHCRNCAPRQSRAVSTSYLWHPAFFTGCWTITPVKRITLSAIRLFRIL
ncbi:hypothetical protein [Agrobacterium pusense]|uniref:hypothetical protein n=1 Tax=Agrobacterium pusense TaxID=648995 RepID=UPI00244963A3|nr:hypothetical protein [Agrobacterium pusense]MDH0117469.1 hypothetical protein [Agrobacterium pusense]